MGFSLKLFFEELENILSQQLVSDTEKLERLEKAIAFAKLYAKDCGQLK
jgi:hypothetical protein